MAITFVRQAVGSSSASTTCSVTITAPTAGNCLVACVYSDSGAVTGITGGGVTWAVLKASAFAHFDSEIWFGLNSSGAAGPIVVTYGASGNNAVNVSEFSGIKTSAAADVTTSTNGVSAVPSSGALTASAGPALHLASMSINSNGETGPGGGFTALTDASNSFRHALGAYQIATSPAALTCSWTEAVTYDMAYGVLLGTVATSTSRDPFGLMGFFGV